MESAVGISAGFSPPEQYRDPAMYARITHNYTIQKSLQMTAKEQVSVQDDKTELLSAGDGDRTELLPENAEGSATAPVQADMGNLSEYVRFFGKGINASSDIYSLGITLYYMLTGIEPPVDFKQRTPIEEANSQVSEGFAIILEKMMAIIGNPSDLYRIVPGTCEAERRLL